MSFLDSKFPFIFIGILSLGVLVVLGLTIFDIQTKEKVTLEDHGCSKIIESIRVSEPLYKFDGILLEIRYTFEEVSRYYDIFCGGKE